MGVAKALVGADAEAVIWMRRGIDLNRNYSHAHFYLAAALARLGELDEARASVNAGLTLDPSFAIHRCRDVIGAWGKRTLEGMRLAGVPEG